ncbi:amphi-Trp domain-containing protein [Micrococcus luteus]|uniref:amphi-Trp domain-containing protein n=1 Tax=Micrococcus luteus TaxID=1270 RepID=UPI0020032FBC|nr:amphi-Trp domain-containing protein [Micrococcus luteus]MCK6058308.1 amphi-Trp domain-containing protein [Micrococcus luteus]MCK6061625.1 amphi-Trp domain-containing protein [Micrococcus luteus]MCK6193312.1 amphi-Trp domain-containing protein [Micrococcus luteus]MCK6195478.1 amphi-Trp domain-containing protein [Micrococcus luteus]
MGKDLFEHEQQQTLSREQAAACLRDLADQLSRQNEVRIEHGGRDVVVTVPDHVGLEVELEVEDDGDSELEITLSW